MNHQTHYQEASGFVMLFTVLLASIILAITIGIANVSYKTLILSSTARDSEYSFYAADTGTECALFFDYKTQPSTFSVAGTGPTNCVGVVPVITPGLPSDVFGVYHEFYFDTNLKYCSLVRVYKDYRPDGVTSYTKIDARGYNLPCAKSVPAGIGGPAVPDPHRVERLLQTTYINPAGGGGGTGS